VVLGAVVAVVAALGGGAAGKTTRIVTAFPALKPAPAGTFTTTAGTTTTLATNQGHPVLAWFVATWCSSCQVGTHVLVAQGLPALEAAGVRVVELELYRNLGQAGPDIAAFGRQYAGAQFANPDWIWGNASGPLTVTADPKGYLDIYYLIGPRGHVRYVSGAPASTLADLLRAVRALPSASL
jgi:cytochrome oxidase Cu insertion factor (SCO1/SenC/PrrC family)